MEALDGCFQFGQTFSQILKLFLKFSNLFSNSQTFSQILNTFSLVYFSSLPQIKTQFLLLFSSHSSCISCILSICHRLSLEFLKTHMFLFEPFAWNVLTQNRTFCLTKANCLLTPNIVLPILSFFELKKAFVTVWPKIFYWVVPFFDSFSAWASILLTKLNRKVLFSSFRRKPTDPKITQKISFNTSVKKVRKYAMLW